jgi:hypothetical protein
MPTKTKSIAETRLNSPARKEPSPQARRVRPTTVAASGQKPGKHAPEKNGAGHKPLPPEATTTKFTFYANPTLALVCMPPDVPALFSLLDAAYLTGVHPEMLRYYSRVGLLQPIDGVLETEPFFDENALGEIRRIEHYRQRLGVGRRALPLVCELRREGERQQIELHFLRYP